MLNINEFIFDLCINGITININILINKSSKPINLFGSHLKIVYADKKYHSGTICIGVTKEFAFINFSTSKKYLGIYYYIYIIL